MRLEDFTQEVDSLDRVHLLVDFDRTLTMDGPDKPSIVSLLRGELSNALDSYKEKSFALKDKYVGYENDPNLDLDLRIKLMEEWWSKHFDLMIAEGLTEDLVNECVDNSDLEFRDGFKELNEFCRNKKVPIVVMSAGVGNMIERVMKNKGFWHDEIHIISNEMIFDDSGLMVNYRRPVIHTLNKKETVIGSGFGKKLIKRPNVILMGDSLGDAEMADGFEHDNICKIAFERYDTSNILRKVYQSIFDEVESYDESLKEVLDYLQSLD